MEYNSTIRLKMSLTMTADVEFIFGGNVFKIEKTSSKVHYDVNLVFTAKFGKTKIEMSSEKPFRINNMLLDNQTVLSTIVERSTHQSNIVPPDKKLESWIVTPLQLDSIFHHNIIKDWHY
jgi:hypothetical protein